jgi:5'-phosphate synthase pdxT subunit
MKKRIGVLAVQGAFAEHVATLNKLNVETFEIRKKSDLTDQSMDGIILPGGESTVIGKLLRELHMLEYLKAVIAEGLPVLGTCAGLILLAKDIMNDNHRYLGTMDITVRRNAYGRQLGSFHIVSRFGDIGEVPMTFIRAPYIEHVDESKGVEILAKVEDHIVAARQKNMLVTSFHPELTEDLSIHRFFLERI